MGGPESSRGLPHRGNCARPARGPAPGRPVLSSAVDRPSRGATPSRADPTPRWRPSTDHGQARQRHDHQARPAPPDAAPAGPTEHRRATDRPAPGDADRRGGGPSCRARGRDRRRGAGRRDRPPGSPATRVRAPTPSTGLEPRRRRQQRIRLCRTRRSPDRDGRWDPRGDPRRAVGHRPGHRGHPLARHSQSGRDAGTLPSVHAIRPAAHRRPTRSSLPAAARTAAARGADAAAQPGRVRGPGPPRRRSRPAPPEHRARPPVVAPPVGTARHRQDQPRPAPRGRDRRALHEPVGGHVRGGRGPQHDRRGAGATGPARHSQRPLPR